MDFNTVLDVSSIIWDEDDYDSNRHQYYDLAKGISMLIEKVEKEKPKILLRAELLNEMMANFPYGKIPRSFSDFETQTLIFLKNIHTITYSASIIPDIVSIPNIVEAHYKDTTKNEVNYLISRIHTDSESQNVYFTFEYLWEGGKLRTEVDGYVKAYETIISDNQSELEDFFAKIKPTFEHNTKHNCESHKTREAWEKRRTKEGFESQLSCFRDKDKDIPQEILNKAMKYKSEYIGYDEKNEVWVRFKRHKDNLYHGFDEYDDENTDIIPIGIKERFHK